jgi:hypothetical protein
MAGTLQRVPINPQGKVLEVLEDVCKSPVPIIRRLVEILGKGQIWGRNRWVPVHTGR